jgi:hypothetical protein
MKKHSYKDLYEKYVRKITTFMKGGVLCASGCGRVAYGKFSTCCGACKPGNNQHTSDCNNRIKCFNNCGRNANIDSQGNYYPGHLCCPSCPTSHTPNCNGRNMISASLYVTVDKPTGGKSIIVNLGPGIKYGNTRTPHFEYWNNNTNLFPPGMTTGTQVFVGPTIQYTSNSLVRLLYADVASTQPVLREDNHHAHMTVYYGSDARMQLSNYQ